ncbi:MAG TPA: class I SAM-dependent methyltransferase [Acidimicrobiales bacterium]|nr:class I SAM-dependent methyltransferase [Acidimicrobiales bacterium]
MSRTLTATSRLRAEDGRVFELDVARWMAPADEVDERLLDRVVGPVLDVGCGPGRHVGSLRRRGVAALGVEISPTAVALARRRGARVLQRSVFDHLPGRGRWRSALLLDGSIGIGGDPRALLGRLRDLLHPHGLVLIETEAPGSATEQLRVRLETSRGTGPWFAWARVGADDASVLATDCGYEELESFVLDDRHFTMLRRGTNAARNGGKDASPRR